MEGLIAGRPSGESQESFKKWLEKKKEKKLLTNTSLDRYSAALHSGR